jgi:hypothetical protein
MDTPFWYKSFRLQLALRTMKQKDKTSTSTIKTKLREAFRPHITELFSVVAQVAAALSSSIMMMFGLICSVFCIAFVVDALSREGRREEGAISNLGLRYFHPGR